MNVHEGAARCYRTLKRWPQVGFDAPPCRAPIALADGRLYARDGAKLVCWNLKK
jgi:hypothetical protein